MGVPYQRPLKVLRVQVAWRYADGTFMSESEKEAAYLDVYERYAADGRARVKTATRASDGTFLPS
jgi:hypothetical protein